MEYPSLAVYLFGYNLEAIAYPWREALRSALELVHPKGAVFFSACDSETHELTIESFGYDIGRGSLRLYRDEWGDHHTVQAHLGNRLLDRIGTEFNYALKLDADEVLCEWSFQSFRTDLLIMQRDGFLLGRPRYKHFCPDDKTTFPFIYNSKAVVSNTLSGLRFDTGLRGDACALGGSPEKQTTLEIHHYGKMHMGRRQEALYKEHEFQKLYTELGFPDPKVEAQLESGELDYMKVFDLAAGRGEFKAYSGRHPVYVIPWLKKMRQKEESRSK